MFSQNQIIFGVLFFLVFVVIITLQYKKDIKIHQIHYRKTYQVLLAFIFFLVLLFALKLILK